MITQRKQGPKRYTRADWTSATELALYTLPGEAITIPPGGTTLLRISAFLRLVVTGGEANATFDYSTSFDVTASRSAGDDVTLVGDDVTANVAEITLATGVLFRVRANDDDGVYTGVLLSFEDDGAGGGTRTKTGYAIVERVLETLGSA